MSIFIYLFPRIIFYNKVKSEWMDISSGYACFTKKPSKETIIIWAPQRIALKIYRHDYLVKDLTIMFLPNAYDKTINTYISSL